MVFAETLEILIKPATLVDVLPHFGVTSFMRNGKDGRGVCLFGFLRLVGMWLSPQRNRRHTDVERCKWIVMDIRILSGDIVSMDMEMIDYNSFHRIMENKRVDKKAQATEPVEIIIRQHLSKAPPPMLNTSNRDIFFC